MDFNNPLILSGRGASIRNGILSECQVELRDQGHHTLRDLTIDVWYGSGVLVPGEYNRLIELDIESDHWGVSLDGAFNSIIDSLVYGDVIGVSVGSNSRVVNNEVGSGQLTSIGIGGDHNRVIGNRSLYGTCIRDSGIGNRLIGNVEDSHCAEPQS
jgi:hypothetical protein